MRGSPGTSGATGTSCKVPSRETLGAGGRATGRTEALGAGSNGSAEVTTRVSAGAPPAGSRLQATATQVSAIKLALRISAANRTKRGLSATNRRNWRDLRTKKGQQPGRRGGTPRAAAEVSLLHGPYRWSTAPDSMSYVMFQTKRLAKLKFALRNRNRPARQAAFASQPRNPRPIEGGFSTVRPDVGPEPGARSLSSVSTIPVSSPLACQ